MRDAESSGLAPWRKAWARARARRRLVAVLALVAATSTSARAARAQGEPAPAAPRPAPVPPAVLARAASLDVATRVDAVAALGAVATPAAWNLVVVMLQRDLDP